MTLFGIENAGIYLGIYLLCIYATGIVRFTATQASDSPSGLMVFAIFWPYFVGRGFVRAVVKGWRELNPRPDKPDDKFGGSGSFQ